MQMKETKDKSNVMEKKNETEKKVFDEQKELIKNLEEKYKEVCTKAKMEPNLERPTIFDINAEELKKKKEEKLKKKEEEEIKKKNEEDELRKKRKENGTIKELINKDLDLEFDSSKNVIVRLNLFNLFRKKNDKLLK